MMLKKIDYYIDSSDWPVVTMFLWSISVGFVFMIPIVFLYYVGDFLFDLTYETESIIVATCFLGGIGIIGVSMIILSLRHFKYIIDLLGFLLFFALFLLYFSTHFTMVYFLVNKSDFLAQFISIERSNYTVFIGFIPASALSNVFLPSVSYILSMILICLTIVPFRASWGVVSRKILSDRAYDMVYSVEGNLRGLSTIVIILASYSVIHNFLQIFHLPSFVTGFVAAVEIVLALFLTGLIGFLLELLTKFTFSFWELFGLDSSFTQKELFVVK